MKLGIRKKCVYCGENINLKNVKLISKFEKQKFCSRPCYLKYRKEKKYITKGICKKCKKPFIILSRTKNVARYCDYCRNNFNYSRNNIYVKRYFCELCGSLINIHSHHIMPQNKTKFNDDINMMGLCKKCHTIITSYYKIIFNKGFEISVRKGR